MDGIILVNKPQGLSSHSVCQRVKRITNSKKCGHTGTLDPIAEGVLIVLCGNATKLSEYMVLADKEYVADVLFGITTDTQDTTGSILRTRKADFTRDELEQALSTFVGEITQTTPIYSAVKIDGRALYSYARRGEAERVELPKRQITIFQAELLDYQRHNEQITARIRVACSKGTYIRTLCNDLGEALCCGAAMSALTRTRTGEYQICDSHTIDELSELCERGDNSFLLPMEAALSRFSRVDANPSARKGVENGNELLSSELLSDITELPEDIPMRLYLDGVLYSLVQKSDGGRLHTIKMLNVRAD